MHFTHVCDHIYRNHVCKGVLWLDLASPLDTVNHTTNHSASLIIPRKLSPHPPIYSSIAKRLIESMPLYLQGEKNKVAHSLSRKLYVHTVSIAYHSTWDTMRDYED